MSNSGNSRVREPQASVSEEEILKDELDEIAVRRQRALHQDEDHETIRRSLVGLALSGGGVRSAAFSLGVLQGLHRYGVLPFIDYLSTVSGGGYTGAYLSSVAFASKSKITDGPESEDLFPIADHNGRQSPRSMTFIHGGRYLRKTWVFLNRYLIGLFLIWVVVFSGLVAIASLVSYLFRMLDLLEVQDWVSALGFQNDVLRAFFPSFILFLLWSLAWGISYFKYARYASGTVAGVFFYLLIASVLVAIAALLGTGDIYLSKDVTPPVFGSFSTAIKPLLFGAIAASLLPYLTPRRLIQSGTNPKNVAERYVFWLATRALAYGVPFVFVSYFTRENISKYNDYRDDRLAQGEVRSWDADSPLLRQLAVQRDIFPGGSIWPNIDTKHWIPVCDELWDEAVESDHFESIVEGYVPKESPDVVKTYATPKQLSRLPVRQLTSFHELLQKTLEVRRNKAELNKANPPEVPSILIATVNFQLQRQLALLLRDKQLDHDLLPDNENTVVGDNKTLERPSQYAEISGVSRWWHLLAYFAERAIGDEVESKENLLAETIEIEVKSRKAKEAVVAEINRQLCQSNFYERFLPDSVFGTEASVNEVSKKDTSEETPSKLLVAFESVSAAHLTGKSEDWGNELRRLRARAKSLHDVLQSQSDKPAPSSSAQSEEADTKVGKAEPHLALVSDAELRAIYAINRKMVAAYYGTDISERSKVYASVVLDEDQRTRWEWFVWSSIVFVISIVFVDLNATSWHGFYSQRISSMWFDPTPGLPKGLPLAQLETTDVGRPYHLLSGAVHTRRQHGVSSDGPKRDQFLFSKLYCGSESTGYSLTSGYMKGECTLEDAVAISGAAVSPVQTDNPLIVALLFLTNIRLGQWVPNPGYMSALSSRLQCVAITAPYTPLRFMIDKLSSPEKRSFCFVTDGGHYENLGIEPLLKRHCRLIIASDAGQDGNSVFADLTRLIRKIKREDGISIVVMGGEEMTLELAKLVPNPETRLAREHFLIATIRYPDGTNGTLIYFRPTVNGDEPFELRQFHRTHDEFPHDPTSDQFYDADRFDSYRALGLHIASQVCVSMGQPECGCGPHAELNSQQFIERCLREFPVAAPAQEATNDIDERPLGEQVRQLLEELRVVDPKIHDQAAMNLQHLGTASFDAMPDLLKALLDERWTVKLCVQSLLYEHPSAAFSHLVSVLEDGDDILLQIAAADVIREYGSGHYLLDTSPAIPALIRMSTLGQVAARVAAARALAVIGKGNPETEHALERCRADRSQRVRDACGV